MPETGGGSCRHADVLLESTLDSVDKAEAIVTEAARRVGFSDDEQYQVGISVRESMVNAVAHGNRYNARKKVHLTVWSSENGLTVEIEDEGPGFNPVVISDPREGDNVLRHSGRGLLMIQAYMDEFEVRRRQPEGTSVRLVKYRRPASKPDG